MFNTFIVIWCRGSVFDINSCRWRIQRWLWRRQQERMFHIRTFVSFFGQASIS